MSSEVALSTIDWVLFALLLFFSLCIGIFYSIKDLGFGKKLLAKVKPAGDSTDPNRSAKNVETKNAKDEYLVGGRKMKVFPVCMSMMASFLSAILVIGTPAEIYEYGFEFWFFISGLVLAIVFVSHAVLPVLYDLNLTSAYEYLEIRFRSKWPRRLGASIFILETLLYMGAAMFAPAVALEGVTDFNAYISMAILGVICTFYTTIGGIKAVMWTDVLQMLIMFVGLLAVLIKGSLMIEGGFTEVWRIARENGRGQLFDADFDPKVRHSVWSLLFGAFFVWMTKYGVNQSSVQRYSSLPTKNKAILTMYLNGPGVSVMHVMACLCGLILYAKFAHCDLKSVNEISSNNQLMLYFVVKYLRDAKGMAGLFTAAIFAGALSSISSGLNSLAAIVCEDVLGERHFGRHSERRQFRTMLALTTMFGILATAMAFAAKNLKGNIVSITFQFVSITAGPSGGLFMSGLLFTSTEWIGATVGCFVSLGIAGWLFLGQRMTNPKAATPLLQTDISQCDLFNITPASLPPVSMTAHSITSSIHNPPAETDQKHPLQDSLYSISYLYWPVIAHLFTLLIALVVGMGVSAMKRRKGENCNKRAGDRFSSKAEICDEDDAVEMGDNVCDKCLGDGQHFGSTIDPKLLSPIVRWLHKSSDKTSDVELEVKQDNTNAPLSTQF